MYPLDILIPVYNEGENIIKVLESIRCSVKTPFQILICYDRETDNTLDALRTYVNAPLMKISLVKNRSQGVLGAVMTGVEESTAPAVLVFAADDTYNAGILDQMFQKFQEGCEIVVASRFIPGGCMEGCPWLKATLVRSAAFTLYHLAGLPTRDATNGFRLFSRRVLEQIKIETPEGWAFSLELLVKAHRRGWKIGEVPALWFERTAGKSKFRVFKWVPIYLRWYFYAFATTYLGKRE
ncbi:glycosyltransferase family 2 protein [Kovacikia minuta CCNUW1]|uniref:glycosyltransferase family 2 protein n=1 Tax=Kovacikia minuta TaxID=2931930 RepID=UPI001CCEFE06|nr:glycosyltransferase family 2 protein [Kovacikia minuta]UBF28446.1 glycosyltransferase family 2 protein [Kovacikia minuta CCNUW1]